MKTAIAFSLAAIGALTGTGVLAGVHMPFVSDGYAPQQQCVQWYDGCNMCQKNEDGITTCSARVCGNTGKGFCREYATSTPQT